MVNVTSGADARALIAYHRVKLYRLAARLDTHPSKLSLIVNGRVPLTTEFAQRLAQAITEEAKIVVVAAGTKSA